MLTPLLSALVRKTIRVDNRTDIRGDIAGSQNSFLFLLPCHGELAHVRLLNMLEIVQKKNEITIS